MKRRILSYLLVLLMVMGLAPMSALAAQNYQANEEPAWEQYTVSAVDYEHACFSFVAVFGKTVNIPKPVLIFIIRMESSLTQPRKRLVYPRLG